MLSGCPSLVLLRHAISLLSRMVLDHLLLMVVLLGPPDLVDLVLVPDVHDQFRPRLG